MGWEVIRQECPEDPGRSRLWDSNAYHVLIRNKGTRAIEGLFLDRCKFNPSQLTTESFKEMNRLRLLKIHNPRRKLFLEDHLPRDFEFSSYELTYLHWDGYPLESLPLNFHAKNLVGLLLRNSNIKQLWRGNKNPRLLKCAKLGCTMHGCVNLELLPRGIYKWKHLLTLSCNGCSKLERFPEIKGNMRELRVLDLSGTAIMDLPSSITHLNGLQTLLLKDSYALALMQIGNLRIGSSRWGCNYGDACFPNREWTSGSAPKVPTKTAAAVLYFPPCFSLLFFAFLLFSFDWLALV
ncbi:putative WRKY transcription factor 19 [Vitis vinifera]|uniref:Putative WRKY transcription factor 19 n=1 Tax=Vitis vinifera TaxID=29760 RepID=A0A438DT60_VITVI|nr:putative WRKY transcription factor 19 [Vitis vinifera]